MLWYLANGSLNDYLKSQLVLQGQYYSGQTTTLRQASFSTNTNTATYTQLGLVNLANFKASQLLNIDEAHVELSTTKSQALLTVIDKVTINQLVLNVEKTPDNVSNVEQLIQHINLQLANDYPELYPSISARIYAEKNPDLNADEYAKNHQQAGPIIEHTKPKKKRGKPQQKLIIEAIHINTLTLNIYKGDKVQSTQKHNISIAAIGSTSGLVSNQIGGEVLLNLLKLAQQ